MSPSTVVASLQAGDYCRFSAKTRPTLHLTFNGAASPISKHHQGQHRNEHQYLYQHVLAVGHAVSKHVLCEGHIITELVFFVQVATVGLKILVSRWTCLVGVGKLIACRRVVPRRGQLASNRVCRLLAEDDASVIAAATMPLIRRVPTCLSLAKGIAVFAGTTNLIGHVIACVLVAVLSVHCLRNLLRDDMAVEHCDMRSH